MDKEVYLKKLHEEILDVMDVVHNICVENNLKYYLAGGSLLGCIRHKGFIPWDDDLDILMPREDFDRFTEIAPKILGLDYELLWYNTKPKYWKMFAKVCKKNTLFLESKNVPNNMRWGIFVDIFPLDETPSYRNEHKSIQYKVHQLGSMLVLKSTRPNTYARFLKKLLSYLISRKTLQNKIYQYSTLLSKEGRDYRCTFVSSYDIKKELSPADWYGIPKLATFENRQYYVSSHPEKILENQYGINYMELPPIEKRRTHYPVKVVFSDSEVFEAEPPKVRLTAKTQE